MFFEIFTIWLTLFTLLFTFLPILTVLDWKRRGTADGFSSVNFVLPMLIQSFWLRHALMRDDTTIILINSVNLIVNGLYLAAFAYYQPKRKYLIGQLISAGLIVKLAFMYVGIFEEDKIVDAMGSVAAGAQIFSLGGGFYEIKRVISLGTTEYVPAKIQFSLFVLMFQWLIFAVVQDNNSMAIASTATLLVNITTISLYFFYPPLTWTVPIFNIQPQDKKNE